ncbi:exonuclease domain-containing protein [Amycolatopsis sp., V23-08]|uniref:Exonuclease domain-containing protein n=1 Tax=Amycolatopsis heterodermiae TaxID=3110235 RepID=A0ABU5RLP2_9PSEU|nr:exonuclease domain-containing protein [Amycolatopsis sp., V23-08]MEA5366051.1 exonuclease domain-containing protein [Amycolatopsis sp., V23-08]
MTWLAGRFLAFDLETTDRDPHLARIVTATTILIDPSTGGKDVTNWLSDVDGHDIPPETTAIHGITTAHARTHGQPAAEVAAQVAATIDQAWDQGIPVIGHNLGYDFTVEDSELRRYFPNEGGLKLRKAVLDTYVLDKHFDRYRSGKRQLVPTAAHYGIRLSEEDAHDATADALASARILWVMARRYPQLAAMTLDALYDAQVAWYREQQLSLAEYFLRQGKTEHVSTEWPIRPVPAVTP